MDKIWANRLIAGTKQWQDVPNSRRDSVLQELQSRVASGEITQERLDEIVADSSN